MPDRKVVSPKVGFPFNSSEHVMIRAKTKWKREFRLAAFLGTCVSLGCGPLLAPACAEEQMGRWITTPDFKAMATNENELRAQHPAPQFRREWEIKGEVKSATLSITSLGAYRAWVNGKLATPDHLAPGWTQFGVRVLSREYDITGMVSPGSNAIGIVLGDGHYRFPRPAGRGGPMEWRTAAFGGDNVPRLITRIRVVYEDGRIEDIKTDETWRGQMEKSPWRVTSFYTGGVLDAGLLDPEWTTAAYRDDDWQGAVEFPAWDGLQVTPAEAPPIRTLREVRAKSVSEPQPGVYVLDFGEQLTGVCRVMLDEPKGTKVQVRYAQALDSSGAIDVSNLHRNKENKDVFIASGRQGEILEIPFTYHGFRYAEIVGLSREPEPDHVVAVHFADALPATAHFTTSDARLQKLWDNIVRTYEGGFKSVLADASGRDERYGWFGDCYTSHGHSVNYMFRADAFHRKHLRDARDFMTWCGSERIPGMYPTRAPTAKGIRSGIMWSDAVTFIPAASHAFFSDSDIVRQNYDAAKAWIDLCLESNGGPKAWNVDSKELATYGEWMDRFMRRPPGATREEWLAPRGKGDKRSISLAAFSTAWWAMSTRLLGQMAEIIGKAEEAKRYGALADQLRNAYFADFDNSDGTWDVDDQAVYAYGLWIGPPDETIKQRFVENLVRTAHAYGDFLSTGTTGSHIVLQQLSRNGHANLAWKLAMRPEYPSFGYMADNGTAIWERFDTYHPEWGMSYDVKSNRGEFNHVGLNPVGEWIVEDVVGLRPDPEQPGFKHFFVVPWTGTQPERVAFRYDSASGPIQVSWQPKDGKRTFDIAVPEGATCTIVWPSGERERLSQGNHSRFMVRSGSP